MERKGTKVNFLYNMVYQVALMILPLITMPYVSRVLGAEGIGTYSYTYSIAQYFLLFGMLGVENYGNRSIARVRDDEQKRSAVFSSIYTLQFIIASISVIVYVLYIAMFSGNKLYAFLQVFYVLSGVFDINWIFFGMEDFKLTVTRKVLVKIINVVLIFAFVKTSADLWKYLLVLSLGYFIAQSSMWLFASKYIKFHFTRINEAFKHFKDILILFIPLVATSIYRMMDKVMLGNFSTMQQVGFYENSEKLINVCLCVISAFGAVMMPRMSNLYARSKYDECRDLFVRSMEIAIFIGCAITFGISSIANDFIPIFYGTGYDACVSITIMLSATVLFITWACIVRTLYLIPTEKNKVYIYSVFLGAGVNVIINWALIPRLASVGAAVGTIIAEVTVAVYQTIMVRKELDVSQCMKKSVPFIIFGSIMFLVVKILPFEVGGNIGSLIAKIFIGAMVYLALSAIYFLKTKNKLFYDVIGKLMKI